MATSIRDSEFDQVLTLRQAFHVLQEFLRQFNARVPQETNLLAGWLELESDGGTFDPAQLNDFLASAHVVLHRDS